MQSIQARQRKLERKRKKREAKGRGHDAPLRLGRARLDMMCTLVMFAWPLIQLLRPNHGAEELEAVLRSAALVWNTIIEMEGDPAETVVFLTQRIRRALTRYPSHLTIMIGALAYRKAEHFGSDERMVAGVDVRSEGGKLRVTATECARGLV
jgi:hypothetical protein